MGSTGLHTCWRERILVCMSSQIHSSTADVLKSTEYRRTRTYLLVLLYSYSYVRGTAVPDTRVFCVRSTICEVRILLQQYNIVRIFIVLVLYEIVLVREVKGGWVGTAAVAIGSKFKLTPTDNTITTRSETTANTHANNIRMALRRRGPVKSYVARFVRRPA